MAVHARPRSTRLLVTALVVASLMTITLDVRAGERGPLAAIGRASLAVIAPLQEAVAAVFRPVGTFFSTLANLGSIRAENARLRDQVLALRRAQAEILDIQRENETLRRLLDLKDRYDFDIRGAQVIAQSVSNFEWAVVIDAGSADGVTLDMPVLGPEGLAGRVVKVGPSTSKVMLIIDPDSEVAVRLATSGEQGLVVGRRERELRLNLIDSDTIVEPGETVSTSGYEGSLFPPGIPVGEVAQVTPSAVDLTKDVLVRPFVDFSKLESVLLVLPHGDVGELGQ